jgi:hypothetical protein
MRPTKSVSASSVNQLFSNGTLLSILAKSVSQTLTKRDYQPNQLVSVGQGFFVRSIYIVITALRYPPRTDTYQDYF